ncbi:unnamed protein product, partial [Chrysoparadoxa australica]
RRNQQVSEGTAMEQCLLQHPDFPLPAVVQLTCTARGIDQIGIPALSFWYASFSNIIILLAINVTSAFIGRVLKYWCKDVYNTMDTRQKHNTKTYIMELIITTPIFFALTLKSPQLLRGKLTEPITPYTGGYAMAYSATWLVLLYTWELLFRTSTNIWLIMHHMATITTVCLALVCLLDTYTEDVALLLILAYSAVTEQTTFLALVLHRFGYKSAGSAFKIAAITSYLFKGAVFCLTWVTYVNVVLPGVCDPSLSSSADGWNAFWRVWIPLVNITLLATQVQANNVLWALGTRMQVKHREQVSKGTIVHEASSKLPEEVSASSIAMSPMARAVRLYSEQSPVTNGIQHVNIERSQSERPSTVGGFILEEASIFSDLVRSRVNSCHFDIDMDEGVEEEARLARREEMDAFFRGDMEGGQNEAWIQDL